MRLEIPHLALVCLVGPSGSGKSTFAARHFAATEVVSSDVCRALVSDDENDQSATPAAFRVLHLIVAERLKSGRLTVVDATNVQPHARKPLVRLARKHDRPAAAIVLDIAEYVCAERSCSRLDRRVPADVVHRQRKQMQRSMRSLSEEGFGYVYVLDSVDAIDQAEIVRVRSSVTLP
jgi:predicted kinase